MTGAKKLILGDHKTATECMVEYTIDLDALLRVMGGKAFRNRTKQTRALWGHIKVTVRPTIAAKGKTQP